MKIKVYRLILRIIEKVFGFDKRVTTLMFSRLIDAIDEKSGRGQNAYEEYPGTKWSKIFKTMLKEEF